MSILLGFNFEHQCKVLYITRYNMTFVSVNRKVLRRRTFLMGEDTYEPQKYFNLQAAAMSTLFCSENA